MEEAYIYDTVRSPRGKGKGTPGWKILVHAWHSNIQRLTKMLMLSGVSDFNRFPVKSGIFLVFDLELMPANIK